jgi:hypothetical protein
MRYQTIKTRFWKFHQIQRNDVQPNLQGYQKTEQLMCLNNSGAGATLKTAIVQPDACCYCSMFFGQLTTVLHGTELLRILANGDIDARLSIEPDLIIRCMAVQPDGKIIVGENFTKYNGGLEE